MEYGYVRVSTKEQNEDRQMVAMREFGIKDGCVILDKQSGKDFERRHANRSWRTGSCGPAASHTAAWRPWRHA